MTDYIETENENALRAHIFQSDDREELLIEVPEWKTKILIKAFSGVARAEYLTFQAALDKNHKGSPEYWRYLWFELARLGCVHPTTKKPIFQIADRDTLLSEKNGEVIDMLGRTVQSFCKLDGTVAARTAKNLSGIQSSTTTTNSLNDSEKMTGK